MPKGPDSKFYVRGDAAGLAQMRQRITQLQGMHSELHKARRMIEGGESSQAETLLKKIVELEPDYFGAWFLLGRIHFEREDWWAAVACFNRSSMLNSADIATLINLSLAYTKLDALELAEQTLELALRQDPKNAKICRALAEVFRNDRDYLKTAELLNRAHRLQPTSPEIARDLGIAHYELGNMDEALHWLLMALKLEKGRDTDAHNLPVILIALSLLPVELDQIDLLQEIKETETLLQDNWPEAARTKLKLAKSRALERAGQHDEAWSILESVNARIWKEVEVRAQSDYKKQQETFLYAQTFDASNIKPLQLSQQSTNPIFIVGASRAGKTTFESLLGLLCEVKMGFESKDFWALPDNVDDKYAAVFQEELSRRAAGSQFFTVTYPGVIHHAGRLARIFDNAVFVLLKRDIRDQVYRCYQKQYAKGNYYSYDLKTCHKYINNYNSIMDLWAEKLDDRCIVLDYEDVVANPYKALKPVALLIGLELHGNQKLTVGDDSGCSVPYEKFMRSDTGR